MKFCKAGKSATDIKIFTGIRDLPAAWDNALPAGHFLRTASLALYEQAQIPDVSYVYVLQQSQDRVLSLATFQVLSIRRHHLAAEGMSSLQSLGWRALSAIYTPKLLVSGHLFRHDVPSFFTAAEMPDFDAFQLYRSSMEAALRYSCAQAVMTKDTPEQFAHFFQNFAPEYLMLRNDIIMELDIPTAWDSMAVYEKALKHKYAQRLRKVRQSWNTLTVKEFSAAETDLHKQDIYRLYRQVSDHQTARLGYLSEDVLPILKAAYPESLKVWGIYEGDRMIAFASAWVKEAAFDMFYIGFDYARNHELQLYFNILFFSLEQAIAFRKPKLILGRTALEAKARLGCKPRYLHTFLYVRNRALRTIVARILSNLQQSEGEWESRHPLR